MRLASWLRRPIVWLPISIGLLALLVWRSRLWEAGTVLEGLDGGLVLGGAFLSILIGIVWAVRSDDLLAAAGWRVGVRQLMPMTAFANTINNLTPGSAGEIVRMYLLRAHHGVDYATSGAIVLIERIGAIGYLASSALLVWLAWLGAIPAPVAGAVSIALVVLPGVGYRFGLRPVAVARRIPLGRIVGAGRWARVGDWLAPGGGAIAGLVGEPPPLV